MIRSRLSLHPALILLPAVAVLSGSALSAAETAAVRIADVGNKVRIEIDGNLFTEYHYDSGAPHVFFYPVLGPGQEPMTRNAPMKSAEAEDTDHPHHRSLWYSHGEVNGVDFWAESSKSGRIVHDRFLELKSGQKVGLLRSANRWVSPEGKVVCTDELTFRVYREPGVRLFDFEVTLKAPDGVDLVLGDTKEGSMGIRLAETMRLKPNKFNAGKPTGHIVQNTGVRDAQTWGKQAAWCDYFGPVAGKTMGVAIFDHPGNPRHPTWWHVRDYGLFAANPFGVHDFEKKPRGTGNFTVPAGKSVTFRYRFYIHPGDDQEGKVADRYREYAGDSTRNP